MMRVCTKKLISVFLVVFTFSTQASTVAEAEALYAQRGDSSQNALQAADIYKTLADTAATNEEKAQMKVGESQSVFYYAGNSGLDKEPKLAAYVRGYEAAKVAMSLWQNPTTSEDKTKLATATYYFGANFGQWGITKGFMTALDKWGELRDSAYDTVKLDESVNQYGAYRILGKGFIKVPKLIYGGDKKKGYAYLEKAYNSTKIEVDGIETTSNMANLSYMVWASKELKKSDEFCEYYRKVEDMDYVLGEKPELLDQHYPSLKPETMSEISETLENDDYTDYYDEKC